MKWYVLLPVVLLLVACVKLTDVNGNELSVRWVDGEFAAYRSANPGVEVVLRAQVKGSIYETGEYMSVFGTCLTDTDQPFPGSFATFSAWYPNGTLFLDNVTMPEIQTGYFLHNSYMSAVQGTYLTEMVCRVNNSVMTAKAWGEWQNPYWVRRLSLLNDSLSQLSNNVTVTLGNLSMSMAGYFNTTWTMQNQTIALINNTYVNLSQQITYASWVANQSVDRNDSYLAYMLQLIAGSTGTPVTGVLSWVVQAEDPHYFREWNMNVTVRNEYNVSVGYPVVSCFVNTTNSPPTIGGLMSGSSGVSYLSYTEKIYVTGDFSWVVWCVYN